MSNPAFDGEQNGKDAQIARTLRRIERLAREQDNRCAYCNEPFGRFEDEANPTLDHVVPRARGGGNNDANLVAACARCNHAKGNMTADDFCARIDAGRLRQRRNLQTTDARRAAKEQQEKELWLALKAAQREVNVGPVNLPHSKNKPLRRIYTAVEVRQWDEDRFVVRVTQPSGSPR